ncbi:MAG: glycosyltransferase [Acidimicrobiales bacterium]
MSSDPVEYDLSVIVSTYARPVQVREAIAAIRPGPPGADRDAGGVGQERAGVGARRRRPHRPVRILFNDHGNGLPGSRNCGAEHASAPILGFCDDDDLWLPAKARRQLTLLKESGAPAPPRASRCSSTAT